MQDLLKGLLKAHVGIQGHGWITRQIADFCLFYVIVNESSELSR